MGAPQYGCQTAFAIGNKDCLLLKYVENETANRWRGINTQKQTDVRKESIWQQPWLRG